jgi:hypothetical protein
LFVMTKRAQPPLLVALVRAGSYLASACRTLGIPMRTYYGAPYRELRQQVERARAEAEVAFVAVIADEARQETGGQRLASSSGRSRSGGVRRFEPPAGPSSGHAPADRDLTGVDAHLSNLPDGYRLELRRSRPRLAHLTCVRNR